MGIEGNLYRHVESLGGLISQIEDARTKLEPALSPGWKEPAFNPKLHLAVPEGPSSRCTFRDLGIPRPASASSEIAGTAPFPLFTLQSIPIIRKCLLNPSYINETAAIFGPKTLILRNTAAHSPFFRRMWTHPSVLRLLSQAAGVELEPVMGTMELGHANVQVDFSKYTGMDIRDTLATVAQDLTSGQFEKVGETKQTVQERTPEEIKNAVDNSGSLLPWHFDSYPWVCVVMISDASNMIGGETVIQRGDGSYSGISQPGMGSAIMLQGGLVKHLALASTSANNDRITIITSFRAKSADIYDSSFMSNIRPYSNLTELYRQWIEYRMDRLLPGLKRSEDRRRCLKVLDDQDAQEELEDRIVLREYAKRTLRQMVPPEIVQSITKRHGYSIFYTVRDDYVSGALFKHPLHPCPLCTTPGAQVEKVHLSVCPGAKQWRPSNPVWKDCLGTQIAIHHWDVEIRKRMEELQVRDVIQKWMAEERPWGILDEMAVQGLGEYIIEFLELFKLEF